MIRADLDLLGQLRAGEGVWFQQVTLDEAEALYRKRQRRLHEWITRLQIAEWFGPKGNQAVSEGANSYADS